ncbi:MAG: hypothetical protein MZV70_22130 [Desulfobacterales bacterium]|nr:hypothetical protein [Desulfobacterales bacterium]
MEAYSLLQRRRASVTNRAPKAGTLSVAVREDLRRARPPGPRSTWAARPSCTPP